MMMALIAETEFPLFSSGASLRAARIGGVEQLSLDRMTTCCQFRGAILRDPFQLIKE